MTNTSKASGNIRGGYPLAALFVMIALCAILAGMLSPLARQIAAGELDAAKIPLASVIAASVMLVLGAVVGAHHYRRWVGALLGGATGFFLGAAVGPLALVDPKSLEALLTASLGGAATLVFVGLVFRITARQSPVAATEAIHHANETTATSPANDDLNHDSQAQI